MANWARGRRERTGGSYAADYCRRYLTDDQLLTLARQHHRVLMIDTSSIEKYVNATVPESSVFGQDEDTRAKILPALTKSKRELGSPIAQILPDIVKRRKMSLFAPGDVLFSPEDVRFGPRKNLFC